MKFLCVPCDQPMKLMEVRPPDRGSLSVIYSCTACGYEMAMLTNPHETQLVTSLGVRIGPEEEAAGLAAAGPGGEPAAASASDAPRCPFTGMIPGMSQSTEQHAPAGSVRWTAGAAERLRGIPEYVRPMAKSGIERFAAERGYPEVDEKVLEEARAVFGM